MHWTEDHLILPRGAVRTLQDAARKTGVALEWVNHARTFDARPIPVEDLGRQPRPYQAECIGILHRKVQGVVQLPCGGGKTYIGSTAALTLGQPTLVLVHMTDLLEQWVDSFQTLTGRTPRTIGGGHGWDLTPLRPGEIVVATVQTLFACPEDEVIPFLESVGALVGDECHRIKMTAFRWILERCPARYRWGLSATPDRPDGWGMLLDLLIGPVVFKRTARELIDLGFLVAPVVVPVDTGWTPGNRDYSWEVRCDACQRLNSRVNWAKWKAGEATCKQWVTFTEKDRFGTLKKKRQRCGAVLSGDAEHKRERLSWGTALTSLSTDPERLRLVGILGRAAHRAGRRTLILMARKSVLAGLERSLSVDGCRAGSVSGSSGKGAREQSIDDLRTGQLDTLIATKLAEEGLDVPDLDCTIVGEPGEAKGRTKQIGGRGCRPAGEWQPIIFELVDGGSTFRRHWRSRRSAYRGEYGPDCVVSDKPLTVAEALRYLVDGKTLDEAMGRDPATTGA